MAGQKLLIIDDGKTIRMQVRDMLPKGTFEVLEAQDGLEGLNLIRQERPNLILLDFFMPRMNGWEVLEKMQAQRELQTIPLVVMSGRKEEVTEKVPQLFDSYEFIEKPFDQKALIGAIKSAMAKAKKRQLTVVTPPKPAEQVPEKPLTGTGEIQELKAQIRVLNDKDSKMQAEIDGLKKQIHQIMTFIKQKKS
ncbi:MAG: response regulator [Aphanothece sp. CMT-3BRIN-NPC111]|jgi:CheY-like chemotaxis protein|nr:response regulator [Aphanothece sp. CMT-3BRIN-NPC111]